MTALESFLRRLAEGRQPEDDPGRRGTGNLIDQAAVLRAASSVRSGVSVSLARTVDQAGSGVVRVDAWTEEHGRVTVGYDRTEVASHGLELTHLDGLNHVGWDGGWYGGIDAGSIPEPTSIESWAEGGLVTRGVHVDIPALRQSDFVERDDPVTADEIETALRESRSNWETGDALLLDMGRDRFEAGAGATYYPAVRPDVAEWIADNGVSVLCWDLLDAPVEPRERLTVHRLIWAIGLAIVDNCDFARARPLLRSVSATTAMLVVAPNPIVGATGTIVNPLLIV